jgi:hypothetical protein
VRETNKLKPCQVEAAIQSGKTQKLSDGNSLYLVTRNGHGFWSFMYRDPETGKLRTKGLGPADRVTLKQAREYREEQAGNARQRRRALRAGAAVPRSLSASIVSSRLHQEPPRHIGVPVAGERFRDVVAAS